MQPVPTRLPSLTSTEDVDEHPIRPGRNGVTSMATMAAASSITRAVPAPILGLAAGVAAYFGLGTVYPDMLTLPGKTKRHTAVRMRVGADWFGPIQSDWGRLRRMWLD